VGTFIARSDVGIEGIEGVRDQRWVRADRIGQVGHLVGQGLRQQQLFGYRHFVIGNL